MDNIGDTVKGNKKKSNKIPIFKKYYSKGTVYHVSSLVTTIPIQYNLNDCYVPDGLCNCTFSSINLNLLDIKPAHVKAKGLGNGGPPPPPLLCSTSDLKSDRAKFVKCWFVF